MIKKDNEPLYKHTTIRIGGIAKNYYEPESIDELIELTKKIPNISNYIISGGSNILINDKRNFEHVLSMTKVNNKIEQNDINVYCGASVRIQTLINYLVEHDLGGIEYLYSLPALIGGIVCMNAGRGKNYNQSISDYIEKVECIYKGKIKYLTKEECDFSYRHSIFQKNSNYIIVGCYFKFPKQNNKIGKEKIRERIDYHKKNQDMSKPNFGSLFKTSDGTIMKVLKKTHFGKKNGVHFSSKTPNWILKEKDGDFNQAIKLIKKASLIHKMFFRKCEIEIKIWK